MRSGTWFLVIVLFVLLIFSLMVFMRESVRSEVVIIEADQEVISFTTAGFLNRFTVKGEDWSFKAASENPFHDKKHPDFASYWTPPDFGWEEGRFIGVSGKHSSNVVEHEFVAENSKPISVEVEAGGPIVIELFYDKSWKLVEQYTVTFVHLFFAVLLAGFIYWRLSVTE